MPASVARPRRWLLAALAALTALALLALPAIPAQATTGGASALGVPVATAPTEAVATEGPEVAFGPSRLGGASWYGPGLYGRQTACGVILRSWTIGVAHRTLPCGTLVRFVYAGHVVVAPVIDRGPYVKGRAWDLTAAAGQALGLEGVGTVRYSVALAYARPGAAR